VITLEHLGALDHRRDHVPVTPTAHLAKDRLLRLSQHLGLVRQAVAKPRDAAQVNYVG